MISNSISLPYLPQNIMEEIFHKLPYDAMTRSKLVCKTWNSIISPKFMDDHYHRLRHEDNHLIFSYYNSDRELNFNTSRYGNLVDDTLSLSPINPLDEPIPGDDIQPRLLGTCNGLVAISCDNKLILWNPLTKEHSFANVAIYEYNSTFNSRVLLGLCYDGNKDEYSVVISSDYQSPPATPTSFDRKLDYGHHCIHLYNFRECREKNIAFKKDIDIAYGEKDYFKFVCALPFQLLDIKLFDGVVGKVVCGVPHWVVKHYDREKPSVQTDILYFDLDEEKFKLMDKPNRDDKNKIIIGLTMLDGENQLGCVLHDVVNECLDVWVMKEYGKAESWNNMFTLSYLGFGDTFGINIEYMDVIGVLSNEELFIYLNDTEFWTYAVDIGSFKKIKLREVESNSKFNSVISYQPKVISPPESTMRSIDETSFDNMITERVRETWNDITGCWIVEDEDVDYTYSSNQFYLLFQKPPQR